MIMNGARSSLFALLAVITSSAFAAETNGPTEAFLVRFSQLRTNAARVTEVPVNMALVVASACRPPLPPSIVEQRIENKKISLDEPHRNKFVHVYVTPEGAPAMKTNSAVFLRGTIILKEKFSDPEGKQTELFTGMVKREKGYNSECGDWEFFTLSADAAKVTSRGKLKNCMDCHVEYKESDYVTKNYVLYPR